MQSINDHITPGFTDSLFRQVVHLLQENGTLQNKISGICEIIQDAFAPFYPVSVLFTYNDAPYTAGKFSKTGNIRTYTHTSSETGTLIVEVYTLQKGLPYSSLFESFFNDLLSLVYWHISTDRLLHVNTHFTERIKELKGIRRTTEILTKDDSLEKKLDAICSFLPEAWQYPEFCAARIRYGDSVFASREFEDTPWLQKQLFETPDNQVGSIEIFYLKEFPQADEGPFLKEERHLLINLANLVAGSATKDILNNLLYENRERLKELHVINHTSYLISQGKPIDETLQKICYIMPRSWQYSRYTVVRITYDDRVYLSREFKDTPWRMQEMFITFDNKQGCIEVFYLKEFPVAFEGPFLKEERQLIINLGKLITGYIDSYKGKEIYSRANPEDTLALNPGNYRQSLVKTKRPLQLFFNQQSLDKYIYLPLKH